jgi:ribosomal protein S12 methylthiotransferase accessory factor
MEAIESWHAERVRLPLRYESYAALSRAAHVIDIARLPRRRGAVIDPASPTLWVEGHDIMTSAEVMVPLECVSTYFVQPTRLGNTFVQDSNGLASGNHILEATVHGLCEVLERDACARWELAGGMNLDDRRVDLSTIPDPDVSHVLDRLDHAGIAVGVWDVTSGTGVPAFMCVIVDEPGAPRWSFQGMFAGAGCHLNATVAVLRALTEAVQSRLTQITGVRDDMTSHSGLADPAEVRAVAAMLKRADGVRFLETDLSAAAFEDDLRTLLARVSKSGLDSVVVVDLSQPEVGIPVVRVIVPGLESSCDQQAPTPGARSRTTAAA